ncbi:DUF4157 domain-containing protein [Aquimarina longa]|uniref:eCIS core domain-containing protein n=1 Tax=Aquimarina longa TaxID=1080221 RepID=UPI0009EA6C92|nr:DUF4157 domain-containing protein [Aquimarina longa]
MKSIFSSRRHKSPHHNEGRETKETPFFSKETKNPFFNIAKGGAVQTKLTVGQPGDKYEKEADSVADAVVSKSSKPEIQNKEISSIQRESLATPQEDEKLGTAEQRVEQDKLIQEKPEIQREEAPEEEMVNKKEAEEEEAIQKKEEEEGMVNTKEAPEEEMINKMEGEEEESIQKKEEEETVQAKHTSGTTPTASTRLSNQIKSKAGGGKKMSKNLQAEMGASFGRDFSDVSIHTDQDAVTMNKELGAQAFTHGKDVYFNSGKYNPETTQGKRLLAHELTHVVQQNKDAEKPNIQQQFTPEKASAEMIGKVFILNTGLISSGGKVKYPEGTELTITSWDNNKTVVHGKAVGSDKKVHTIILKKSYIQPKGGTSGLYQYNAGVEGQVASVEKGEQKIADWEKKKPEYKKFNNLRGYEAELKRLKGVQEIRQKTLNRKLIQETMFNAFDASIKKWTDYYHKQIGAPNKWDKLDPNIVKSMIFQESQMGTSGQYLYESQRYEGDPMTRFNLMQAIDSSGSILTLMMNEMDAALAAKYKINDVKKDLYKAQKEYKDLQKKASLTSSEKLKLSGLQKRSGNGKTWDYFYWSDTRFYGAWKEFNKKPIGKDRNIDYDFWVRTGIRWVFEKRKSVLSWAEAVRAYNGRGSRAVNYKSNVIKRRNEAKSAHGKKNKHKPRVSY